MEEGRWNIGDVEGSRRGGEWFGGFVNVYHPGEGRKDRQQDNPPKAEQSGM